MMLDVPRKYVDIMLDVCACVCVRLYDVMNMHAQKVLFYPSWLVFHLKPEETWR